MQPSWTAQHFGRSHSCSCGRTHTIEPSIVVYQESAVEAMPDVCARVTEGRRVVVLSDERTGELAGKSIGDALRQAGWRSLAVTVPDPADNGTPVCDDVTCALIQSRLGPTDLVVSVGSGVMTDLGKWIAFNRHIPAVAFATAASMNGYASANVAPTIAGVKTLLHARPPAAVVADAKILREAPWELTSAGLGDATAKGVSGADWYLNHLIFGDSFCQESVDLCEEVEPLYFDHPRDVHRGKPAAIEGLYRAMLLTGVAMTMAETSAPASGGEHLISHALDMHATVIGRKHDLHGRQVGVGTVLASALYERLLAMDSVDWRDAPLEVDKSFWGPLSPVLAEAYNEKLPRLRQARQWLSEDDNWDRLREALSGRVRPAERTYECLMRAGAAHRASDIDCDRHYLSQIVERASQMRPRVTVLDLAAMAGLLPWAAPEVVEEWA